jgi:hypothetical protein
MEPNRFDRIPSSRIISRRIATVLRHRILQKSIKGAGCKPAPSRFVARDSLHDQSARSSVRYMPALISVCSVAALAASFCCSAAAIDAFSALVSFID